jgi:hypothetical protein
LLLILGGEAYIVRENEYQLLLRACYHISESYPHLQRAQHESVGQSAASIKEEIESFLGEIFRDREQTRGASIQKMEPLLAVFDLGLLQICDLSHFAWRNLNRRTKLIWPDATLPKRPNPTGIFYLLASNLAQLLQAVRLLLLCGFEGQSRAMVRTFVEFSDLSLAVVADESVYRKYITTYEDQKKEYQHWRQYLAPGVIRRRLSDPDEELALKAITGIPAKEVREDTYKWLSLFSHVNLVAHLVSAYPQSLDGQGMAPLAMLGEAGEMTRATFSRILLYLWLFFLHFDKLLWEKHRWARFRGSHSRNWYQYRSKVFDALFRENHNKLQGIPLGGGA